MMCDFYPIESFENGLYISYPEILLIIWVTLFTIDEMREVKNIIS